MPLAGDADTDTWLQELQARALAEQPELPLDREGFVEHLAHLGAAHPPERRGELHAGDLAIAYACAHQDRAALQAFEAIYIPALRGTLLGRGYGATQVDDLLQEIRERFLIGTPEAPAKLLAYGGRGPLGAWLRVAALRLMLTNDRRNWREVPLEDAMIVRATTNDDPLREERIALLRVALREAITELTGRQRAVMRLYYSDEIGVEELGRMYRVHASTISRWLAQARVEIMARTRSALTRVVVSSPSAVESLLKHAASVELSLDSLLRTAD